MDNDKCEKITIMNVFLNFAKEYKLIFITWVILVTILSFKDVVLSVLIGKLYDNISIQKKAIFFGSLLIIFNLIAIILDHILEINDAYMFAGLQKSTRKTIISHVFDMYNKNYGENYGGKTLSYIIRFPFIVYTLISNWLEYYVPHGMKAIAVVIYMMFINAYISLAILVSCLILIFTLYASFKRCSNQSLERDTLVNGIYSDVEDTLNNLKMVLTTSNQDHEIERINYNHPMYIAKTVSSKQCIYRLKPLVPILFFIILVTVIAGYLKKSKRLGLHNISKGKLITMCILIYFTYNNFLVILDRVKDSLFVWGSIQNILKLLNDCNSQDDIYEECEEEDVVQDGILIKNLVFKHNNSKIILNDVNVRFRKNKTSMIVGDIGGGKSTLFDLILRYKRPNRGSIYMDGKSMCDMSVNEIRRQIGYVQQHPILFDRSLYENLTYGLNGITHTDVTNKIEELGLTHFFNKAFPYGLDTIAGNRGGKLSGGQKQILSLIRLSLSNPEYILMDEPTSSLDSEIKSIIMKLLDRFSKEYTMIIITHDPSIIHLAHDVYELKDGKISKKNNVKK